MKPNVPLWQGPGAPWCAGSVYNSTQILTVEDAAQLGPLLFDRVNNPQTIFSTGSKLYMFNEPINLPAKGIKNCKKIMRASYLPTPIVKEHLKEDLSIKLAMIADSNHVLGNRLQALKYEDGKTFLIFPCGKNGDTVGALGITWTENGQWKPLTADGLPIKSASLSHPILQLASLDNQACDISGKKYLVARTSYHVHISSLKMGKNVFGSVTTVDFDTTVSHIAANSHLQNEFAAILDTGNVHIYDIRANRMQCGNLPVQNVLYNDVAFKYSCEKDGSRVCSSSEFPGLFQKKLSSLEGQWWHGEYAWHPKTFLLASVRDVSLIDFRENKTHRTVMTSTRSVGTSSSFCHAHNSGNDRFLAFARADYDGMFYFATATQDHVCLFDARRPVNPVLQWEHKMVDDFPGVLMMEPLSMLRPSRKGGAYHKASVSGRVILASAFRSGDMRVFCYGPREPFCTNGGLRFESGLSTSDLEEAYCTWQLPSKIHAPKADSTRWREFLASLQNVCSNVEHGESLSLQRSLECMSGLVLLPNLMDSFNPWGGGFSLFQLTGHGDILAGTYRASETVESGAAVWEAFPHFTGYLCKDTDLSIQSLPQFLSYFHGGSCLKPILDNRGSCSMGILARSSSTLKQCKAQDSCLNWLEKYISHINKPLSIYEIATAMLRGEFDESVIAEIGRVSKKSDSLPYQLPTIKLLNQDDVLPRSELPLPFLLEIQQLLSKSSQGMKTDEATSTEEIKVDEGTSNEEIKTDEGASGEEIVGGHKCISDACDLVKSTLTRLKEQDDALVSLSDPNNPWERDASVSDFFEHKVEKMDFSPVTRLSPSFSASKSLKKEANKEDRNPWKSRRNDKSTDFICSSASCDEDDLKKLGIKFPPIQLHKEIPEFNNSRMQAGVIDKLQTGWANWLENFEPYQKYQSEISRHKTGSQ